MEIEGEKLADGHDVYAAVEYLAGQDDLVSAVKVLNKLQRKAYWEQKNIGRCVAFGRAGVQLGLLEGRRISQTDPELGDQLLGQAKAVSYNLASFAWPGWDEEGIDLSPSDIAMGFDAARVNQRLAIELERGPDPMGKAHWLLGAHHLPSGDLDNAREQFRLAEAFEKEVDPDQGGLLQEGYLIVVDLIERPGDPDLTSRLQDVQKRLREVEEGEFLADQLSTALDVFTRE